MFELIRRSLFTSQGCPASRKHRRQRLRTTWRIEQLEVRVVLSTTTGMPPFFPSEIRHAYGFDQVTFSNGTITGDGTGQTIAIVDAYHDPDIYGDVDKFDSDTQTTPGVDALSFLTQVKLGTSTTYDSGWALESALDVEWAHGIAPGAKILLVEANSSSFSDMFSAVSYAANYVGVSVVSMSWGAGEFSSETTYDKYFVTPPSNHPGVTFLAASGDNGSIIYPSSSPNVVAVGGTALKLNADASWKSETAWSGSGGGISRYEKKPSYQKYVTQSSTKRTTPDVAYDGDPNTGFYVVSAGTPYQVGGTSAGAPQWAALFAIANEGRVAAGKPTFTTTGTGSNLQADALSALYSLPASDFHDITSGGKRIKATAGYDLVTGRGSPKANLIVQDLVNWVSVTNNPLVPLTGTSSLATGSPTGAASVAASSVSAASQPGQGSLTIIGSLPQSPAGSGTIAAALPPPAMNVSTLAAPSAVGTASAVPVQTASASSSTTAAANSGTVVGVASEVRAIDVAGTRPRGDAQGLLLNGGDDQAGSRLPGSSLISVGENTLMADHESETAAETAAAPTLAAVDAGFVDFERTALLLDETTITATVDNCENGNYPAAISAGLATLLGGCWFIYGRPATAERRRRRMNAALSGSAS